MLRYLPLAFFCACSLSLPALPEPGLAAADAGNPPSDAGGSSDAGGGSRCGEGEQPHPLSGACVPMRGEGASCIDPKTHPWVVGAQTVRYVSSDGAGDGSEGAPMGFEAAVAAANEAQGTTALVVAAGDYSLAALTLNGSLRIVGPCAAQATLSASETSLFLAGPEASLGLYGLSIVGSDGAADGPLMALDRSASVELDQLRLRTPSQDVIVADGVAQGSLRGLNVAEVGGSFLRATDLLGTWTIEGNLIPGPVGEDALHLTGAAQGQVSVTINDNEFGAIAGKATDIGNPLATWTIEGNLIPGPVGDDGFQLTGGGAQAEVTIRGNRFERIGGAGIDAAGPLGTWTIEGNLIPGPVEGTAIVVDSASAGLTIASNSIGNAAQGIDINGAAGSVTVSNNSIESEDPAVAPWGGISVSHSVAEASVTVSGNTLSGLQGVGLTIASSAATVSITGNTFRNTAAAVGGAAVTAGVGLAIVDASNLTITGNSYTGNALVGALLDYAGWGLDSGRPELSGEPVVSMLEADGAFADNGRNAVARQHLPEQHRIEVDINGGVDGGGDVVDVPDGEATPVERPVERPLVGCGDGIVSGREACDLGPANGASVCSSTCSVATNWNSFSASPRRLCGLLTMENERSMAHCVGYSPTGTAVPGISENGFPLPMVVEMPGSPARQLVVGRDHGCALLDSGAVFCWGDNRARQVQPDAIERVAVLLPQPIDQPVVAIAAALNHNCAIDRTGRVLCWGGRDDGALGAEAGSVANPTPVQDEAGDPLLAYRLWTGPNANCAMVGATAPARPQARLTCWGNNGSGLAGRAGVQLGAPFTPPNSQDFIDTAPTVDLAIGYRHICAVDASGGLSCWGDNRDQRFPGNAEIAQRPLPVLLPAGVVAKRVFISAETGATERPLTCVTTSTEAVYCYGRSRRRLSQTELPDQAFSLIDDLRANTMAIASHSLCASGRGGSSCMGPDTFVSDVPSAFTPPAPAALDPALPQGTGFERLALGGAFGLAMGAGGQTYAWGSVPQDGGAEARLSAAVRPIDVGQAVQVAAAADQAYCLTTEGGSVHCSGALGEATFRLADTLIAPAMDLNGPLACGADHCCAAGGSRVACWGDCRNGRCNGLDGSARTSDPVFTTLPDEGQPLARVDIVDMAVGDEHSCILTIASGPTFSVRCWGNGAGMALGNGITDANQDITVLTNLGGQDAPIESLTVGGRTGCALTLRDRATLCWGDNGQGVAGQALNVGEVDQPTTILNQVLMSRIQTNGESTCFMAADTGRISCFGDNSRGVANPSDPEGLPVLASDAEPVSVVNPSEVAMGDGFACALDNAGQLSCWGDNANGRLGHAQRVVELPAP